jgi:hypothetical protein
MTDTIIGLVIGVVIWTVGFKLAVGLWPWQLRPK